MCCRRENRYWSSSIRSCAPVTSKGASLSDALAAVAAMAEEGIDLSAEVPKVLTVDAVKESDVVITMGCGDSCPIFPGKRYEDWALEDPAGQGIEAVRPIRDQIKSRIQALILSLAPTNVAEGQKNDA